MQLQACEVQQAEVAAGEDRAAEAGGGAIVQGVGAEVDLGQARQGEQGFRQ